VVRRALTVFLFVGLVAGQLFTAEVASTACAAPPPNITIRKMIVKGTTFSEYFHTPFLGSGQVDP
jgi:hypothetical protein